MPQYDTNSENWQLIYRELASIVGEDNTLKIYEFYRGLNVNFPVKLYSKEGLSNIIKEEYNGSNTRDIARKYGYSMRHVNRVIREFNKRD